MDTATTASGAGAAAFMAFFALALFVLCLMAIMSLAEKYKSLSSRVEEYKGACPFANLFLIPTVVALAMPPVAVALAFVKGGDLTGILHFNGAFMIPFIHGILPTILYRSRVKYQLQDLAISSISSLPQPQVLLGAGTLCALGQEIVQDISWLPNLTGWHFHPVRVLYMKFTNNRVVYYFLIAYMSLILLQLEFGPNRVLQE